jgi:hypothetical protein
MVHVKINSFVIDSHKCRLYVGVILPKYERKQPIINGDIAFLVYKNIKA